MDIDRLFEDNKFLEKEYAQKYGAESLKEVKEWENSELDWEY